MLPRRVAAQNFFEQPCGAATFDEAAQTVHRVARATLSRTTRKVASDSKILRYSPEPC